MKYESNPLQELIKAQLLQNNPQNCHRVNETRPDEKAAIGKSLNKSVVTTSATMPSSSSQWIAVKNVLQKAVDDSVLAAPPRVCIEPGASRITHTHVDPYSSLWRGGGGSIHTVSSAMRLAACPRGSRSWNNAVDFWPRTPLFRSTFIHQVALRLHGSMLLASPRPCATAAAVQPRRSCGKRQIPLVPSSPPRRVQLRRWHVDDFGVQKHWQEWASYFINSGGKCWVSCKLCCKFPIRFAVACSVTRVQLAYCLAIAIGTLISWSSVQLIVWLDIKKDSLKKLDIWKSQIRVHLFSTLQVWISENSPEDYLFGQVEDLYVRFRGKSSLIQP